MNPADEHAGVITAAGQQRIPRHRLADRLLHWGMAICMLVLLGTSLLPIVGIKFEWVLIHWVTGLILTVLVVIHIIRAVLRKSLSSMWLSIRDIREELENIRLGLDPVADLYKYGKYSAAQKLYHHLITVVILTAIVTGLLMLVRIDSPLWERNPYWLSQDTWGIVYVLHGFTALFSVTLILIHIYFAFRPEKFFYTRSMILGWITRDEYLSKHRPDRWNPDK